MNQKYLLHRYAIELIITLAIYTAIIQLSTYLLTHTISFAAGLTGLLTFTYSYLQQLGTPTLDLICVLPIMLIFWGFGVVFFARKYR